MHPLALAIGTTLVLGAAKLIVAVSSGSNAVAASAADSLGDALMSGLNLLMMRQAAMPPDEGHPWGHGKAEALASLAQAIGLAAVVGFIAYHALRTLVGEPGPAPATGMALGVMVVSMAGLLAMSQYLAAAAKRTGSLVLRTDAVHYRMDIWTGGAVVVGLMVTKATGSGAADSLASLIVSALMVRDVWGVGRDAIDELMDRPLPLAEQARVAKVLEGFRARVISWHDLRTRRSGPSRFVQVHIVLPADMSFAQAHRVSDEVEAALRDAIPNLDVLVHADVDGGEDLTDGREPA